MTRQQDANPTAASLAPVERLQPLASPMPDAAPLPAPSPGSPSITRHWRSMLVVGSLSALLGLAYVWTARPPLFHADAAIELQPADVSDARAADAFYKTQARLAHSPRVLDRVLQQRDPVQLSADEPATDRGFEPYAELVRNVAIELDAPLLTIRTTHGEPRAAADLANAVAAAYLAELQASTPTPDAFVDLEERIDQLRQEATRAESELQIAQRDLQALAPDGPVERRRSQLDDLRIRRDNLRLQQSQTAALLDQVKSMKPVLVAPVEQQRELRLQQDEEWRKLTRERADAQLKLDTASQQLGNAHPTIIGLRKRIAHLHNLQVRREQIVLQQPAPHPAVAVAGAGHDPQRLEFELERLAGELQALDEMITGREQGLQEEVGLATALQERAQRLERVRAELARAQADYEDRPPIGTARLLAEARAPATVAEDARFGLSALVVGSAVFLGFGTGLIRSRMSPGVSLERSDVATRWAGGAPLGLLPEMTARVRPQQSAVSNECVRMVRTALLQQLRQDSGSVVQITSAGPGAGKTTVAVMLARSLAEVGKRVLLVDGDLRNPSLARHFELETTGSDVLDALVETDPLRPSLPQARATSVENLEVLVQGCPVTADQAQILAGSAPQRAFEAWRHLYDIVLLDSSPILPVADGRLVARHADGTAFVVRESHCNREEVVEALAYLRAAGGTVLGTVFNAARHSVRYHGAYHYKQSYAGGPVHEEDDPRVVRVLSDEN